MLDPFGIVRKRDFAENSAMRLTSRNRLIITTAKPVLSLYDCS